MGLSSQPRAAGGRFGEKLEVGVQRRLSEALRRALGHDGTDGDQDAPDELDARLAAQLDVADDLDVAVADAAPADATSLLVGAGKSITPTAPVIELTGTAGRAFSDDAGHLWTEVKGAAPELLGSVEDAAAYDRFLAFTTDHGLREPGDPAAEAPVTLLDDDARLAAQEKTLLEAEEKVRKFDADKHPRDWRGRFATIGSTVSLPDSAGGGEGRVVAATGSNHVRVRKADGTEIDVDAKDTEVTASAAANAAHDSFVRAGQGGGFDRAGADAAVGGPAAAPGVSKPRAKAPNGKPEPSPAKPPPAKPDAQAERKVPAEQVQVGDTIDHGKLVTGIRTEGNDVVFSVHGGTDLDGKPKPQSGYRVPKGQEVTVFPDDPNDPEVAKLRAAKPDAKPDAKPREPVRRRATTDLNGGTDAGREMLRVSRIQPGDTVRGDDGNDHVVASTRNVGNGRVELTSEDGWKQTHDDRVRLSVLDDTADKPTVEPSGGPAKPAAKDEPLPTGTSVVVTNDQGKEDATVLGTDRDPVTGQRFYLVAHKDGTTEKYPAERVTPGGKGGTGPEAMAAQAEGIPGAGDVDPHAGLEDVGDQSDPQTMTDDELLAAADDPNLEQRDRAYLEALMGELNSRDMSGSADLVASALGRDGATYGDELDTLDPKAMSDAQLDDAISLLEDSGGDDARLEALTAEQERRSGAPVGVGGEIPEGGEWGQAPESIDDGIDRSTWTGGQPPGGFDGSGTRPDGTAWGSGYPDGDPRQDPAYDQYTADMDEKLDAGLAKYGDTEALLDKVDGAPNAYRPERHAEHDKIIDDLMAGYADIPRENRAVIMAGPPGAGKTTVIVTNGSDFGVTWDEAKRRPGNYAVVNPDDMKEELVKRGLIPAEYDEYGLAPAEMASFIHEESSWLAERLLTRLKADGVNLILDGTFAGKPDKQVGKVHTLRADGYSVKGVLVDGTVDRSLTNAGQRHKRAPEEPGGRYGGRYVPMGHIASNNPSGDQDSSVFGRPHRNKSSENIERAQDAFDEGVAWYDNSTGESKKIHDTFPAEEQQITRRLGALGTRIGLVTDPKVRAALQTEYDNLVRYFEMEFDSFASAWLDRGGAELEAKTLEALVEQKAEGGADRNRGGAEQLRRYWVRGEGAAKIGWGTDGDFARCVALVSEHMDPERAKGYCNLRHQDAVGKPPGQGHKWLGKVERKETPPPTHQNDAGENTLPNENPEPTGVMVALYPADDIVSALALDGGEAASDLHVTLAYLGKVDEIGDPQKLIDAVAALAKQHGDLEAMVSGLGRWDAGEDGDAFVALVDSPELGELRQAVCEAVEAAGHPARADHGFTPHITLAYLTAEDPTPVERIDSLPATFQFLSLAIGPDVYDFPLSADDGGRSEELEASNTGEGDAPYDKQPRATDPAV